MYISTIYNMVNNVFFLLSFSQMAPDEEVVNNIGQFLLPTTESGDQDHNSLLDVHTYFNECITEKGIKKHVVILSDGHSSRFNAEVMEHVRD